MRKYDYKILRLYIALARRLNPILTNDAAKALRENYKILRSGDKLTGGGSYRATVRQL